MHEVVDGEVLVGQLNTFSMVLQDDSGAGGESRQFSACKTHPDGRLLQLDPVVLLVVIAVLVWYVFVMLQV